MADPPKNASEQKEGVAESVKIIFRGFCHGVKDRTF
jgi:hypothetical protein